MLVADAMVQLAAAAPLHHDMHVLVVLVCVFKARHVQRAPQLAHDVHLAPYCRQVARALLLGQRRVVQHLSHMAFVLLNITALPIQYT